MDEVEIFSKASEIDDPGQRRAFLDRACDGNVELKHRLEAFLRSAEVAGSFMESPFLVQVIAANPDQTMASQDGQPVAADNLAPHVLGDYRILQEIGRGGMGVVYEAEQISLGRRVALKVLPYASMLDKNQLTRFQNEARAAASLEHPNVVHVYSVGTERGVHYFAMQLIIGQSLDEMVKVERRKRGILERAGVDSPKKSSGDEPTADRSISDAAPSEEVDLIDTAIDAAPAAITRHDVDDQVWIRAVVELAVQAAEALEHAHRMGIVHRDIKPSNLLIDADQHLWVADFGLALIEANANLTTSGSMIGTLRYMSPEQMRGDRHVLDHHTDIYSLGTTLYEMLTLRPAFPDGDVTRLMQRISHDEPVNPRKLNFAIPRDLETVVLKAMAKDHANRYATAGEMAADLRRVLNDEPIRARPPNAIERARKWARRHRAVVTTTVATLLLAIAVAGSLLWRERSETLLALDSESEQRRLAVEQKQIAQEQFERAEANLELALEALDEVYLKSIDEEKCLRESGQPRGGGTAAQSALDLSPTEREFVKRGVQFYDRFAQQNRDNPEVLFETGKAFYRVALLQIGLEEDEQAKQAFADSISRYEQLTRQFPNRPEYFLELGRAYYGQGRLSRWWPSAANTFEQAEAVLSKAIALDAKLAEAYAIRGKAYDAQAKHAEALADHKTVVELTPNDALAHLRLGQLFNVIQEPDLRDYDLALTHAKRAVDLDPEDPKYRVLLSLVYQNRFNDKKAAAAVWRDSMDYTEDPIVIATRSAVVAELLGDHQQTIAQVTRFMELAGESDAGHKHGWMYFRRANAYEAQERVKEALADLDKAAAANTGDEYLYIQVGKTFHRLGEHEKAFAAYQRAEEVNPNNVYIYEHRVSMHLAANHYQEALAEVNRALQLAPHKSWTYKRRAYALYHLERYEAALSDLEKGATQLNPTDSSTLTWIPPSLVARCPDESFREDLLKLADSAVEKNTGARGSRLQLYLALGVWDKARTDLDELTASDAPGYYDCYQYALLCLAQKDVPKFREMCAAMVAKFGQSDDPKAANFAAWACALQPDAVDDFGPAIELARAAVEQDAENGQFQGTLGAILYRAGQHEEARNRLSALAKQLEQPDRKVDSSPAYAWYFLAMAQKAAGDDEKAREYLAKANERTDKVLGDEENPPAWNRRATLEILRREAETLLKNDDEESEKSDPKPEPESNTKTQAGPDQEEE